MSYPKTPDINLNLKERQQPRRSADVRSRFVYLGVGTLIFLLLGVSAAYMLGKRQSTVATDVKEQQRILDAVGSHIVLPENIEPKIGKIENPDQFKDDPFLSQSALGDYVLFYPYEGRTVKAILWRPSITKIVDVALVTIPALSTSGQ